MHYYLIENLMGFENPVEMGQFDNMKLMKERYEREARNGSNRSKVEVTYYIVPKDEWDIQHCPLIPVDFP